MDVFLLIVFWIGLCAAVGIYADKKGRSGAGFFFLAFMLSPIIGGLIALAASPDKAELDRRALREGMRKCPQCAEFVRADAHRCRYCGSELQVLQPKSTHSGELAVTPKERRKYDIIWWTAVALIIVIVWASFLIRTWLH